MSDSDDDRRIPNIHGYDEDSDDSESSDNDQEDLNSFRMGAVASKMPKKSVASKQPRYASKRPMDSASKSIPVASKRPKPSHSGASFIDAEAEDDDDDDDNEEEEEVEEEEAMDEDVIDETESAVDYAEVLANARSNRDFALSGVQEADALERQAEEYEDRYRNVSIHDDTYNDDEDLDVSSDRRAGVLPSIRDPKLWLLKCKPGKERVSVLELLNSYIKNSAKDADRLFIKSAFTTDSSPGYLYVEADKESHVRAAIEGNRWIQSFSITLVPIKEMVQALTVKEVTSNLERGQWVRIKRGMYKDDVAQVVDAQDQQTQVCVRLIPRLDINKIISKLKADGTPAQRATKAPQALFDVAAIREKYNSELGLEAPITSDGRHPQTGLSCYMFQGNFYRRGFLYKTIRADGLITTGVNPTILELELFKMRPADSPDSENEYDDGPQLDDDLSSLTTITSVDSVNPVYSRGDTIRVIRGDLQRLTGTVTSVFGDSVKVSPLYTTAAGDLIDFPMSDIRKFFKMGDHVKIVRGEYNGETGLIVRVEDEQDLVIIFSDISNREMKVLAKDIIESSEVSTGRDQLGNFELYDLVAMSRDAVGVIVRVEMGYFQIMDQKGTIHRVRLQEVTRRRDSKFAVALDANDNQISRNDVVVVKAGPHGGKQATIKHIFRSFVFLISREITENGGIFVSRARECASIGQFKQQERQTDANMRGGQQQNMSAPMRRFRDPLVGETVTIRAGPYKSLMGIVKDATETSARIELHSQSKVVTVPRNYLATPNGDSGPLRREDSRRQPSYGVGSQTPMVGSRTPMHNYDSSRTPNYVPQTPMSSHGGNAWATTPAPASSTRFGSEHYTPNSITPMPATPNAGTPGPHTPAPSTPFASTPFTPGGPNTPNPATPLPNTPGGPGTPYDFDPQSPHTPAADMHIVDWAVPGVLVKFRHHHEGVVVENLGSSVRVEVGNDVSLFRFQVDLTCIRRKLCQFPRSLPLFLEREIRSGLHLDNSLALSVY